MKTKPMTRLDYIHYEMQPRYEAGGFRRMAMRLLRNAGFATSEQAWQALRDQLPDQPALVVDSPNDCPPDIALDYARESLLAALVLGKCCGNRFSPARTNVWSERRLARSLRLVHSSTKSITRSDEERFVLQS